MKKLFLIVMIISMVMVGNVSALLINQTGYKVNNPIPFKVYEVKSGDTLSEIAYLFGVKIKKLITWNPKILKLGIHRIYPGMKIKYKLSGDSK